MNNKLTVTAKCCFVGEIETVGKNGFKKRTFTLKEELPGGQYPTYLAFTLKQKRCDLVSHADEGRTLTVTGFAESRDWTDRKTGKVKFFTDITAIKVERAQGDPDETVPDAPVPPEDDDIPAGAADDDMPF